jgi:4-amino-4-deoxy-L-arabinose transferase-like glycosyltransferase
VTVKTSPAGSRLRTYLPESLVLLLALAARLWGIDYHSLWFDESVSMTWARSTPDYAWESTFQLVKDKHPPAYYLLLHFWRQLFVPFGLENNDIALRLLGSLLGVLTVLALLLLVRRLSGRPTALLAGTLAALGPALVWYSQELRMFQPAATALTWGAFCLCAACGSPHPARRFAWWLGMIAALTLAVYSYLFAAFALPAAGLVLLAPLSAWWRTRQSSGLRIFGEGAAALAVTAVLFLPLARNAWLANASDGTPGRAFMDLGANLLRQLEVATVWRVDWPWLPAALALFGGLLFVGLLLPWPRRHADDSLDSQPSAPLPSGALSLGATLPSPAQGLGDLLLSDRLFLWAWLGAPLLVGNLLLARNDTIFAEDRYFLYLAPFALWAIARGAVALGTRWRPGGILLGAAAVVLLAAALPRLWSPSMLREDWRAAANYIADYQEASPGLPAAAVAHVDYTRTPLNWYLRKRLTRDQLAVFFPFGGALTPEEVEQVVAPPLRGIEETGVTTLWLTQSHLEGIDDARLVEGWLNAAYPLVTEQYPTGVKLSGYAVQHTFPSLPELQPDAVTPNAELAPGLLLAACEITTPVVAARDERMHPPSGWVHVRLWWQAAGAIDDDYIATVRMVGPEGVWGDRLYRENETLRRWPTSTWQGTDFRRDEVDVNLNPLTPPGTYPIVVGLMDSEGQETGQTVECGRVTIQ